ncbi:18088_t:CDS:2, partial [Dentiscutata erythropus]
MPKYPNNDLWNQGMSQTIKPNPFDSELFLNQPDYFEQASFFSSNYQPIASNKLEFKNVPINEDSKRESFKDAYRELCNSDK